MDGDTRPLGIVDVEPLRREHWPDVHRIYEEGIATGNATFQTEPPAWEAFDAGHLPDARLIARDVNGHLVGWVALSPVSNRCVYSGVAEVSIYVSSAARGWGVGRALLEAAIRESEQAGIWTLQGGVFPENGASVRLLESCGFRVVGRRERLGKMGTRWRDVLLLERRSHVAGT
jgi:L-amino acid N-acyltransferase YncA